MKVIDNRKVEQEFTLNVGDILITDVDDYLVVLSDCNFLSLLEIDSLTLYEDRDINDYHLDLVNSKDYLSRLLHEWFDVKLLEVVNCEQVQILLKGDK